MDGWMEDNWNIGVNLRGFPLTDSNKLTYKCTVFITQTYRVAMRIAASIQRTYVCPLLYFTSMTSYDRETVRLGIDDFL